MIMRAQKKHAPATDRNREPILAVLKDCLPEHGTILEIASGSGQHAIYFVDHMPGHYWLPSDPDLASRDSISAWWWDVQLKNILPPLNINTLENFWPVEKVELPLPVTAMVCINMIHISPWESAVGLMKGAARVLPEDGILYLYGPYKIDGEHTAPSNELFDLSLQSQNPDWGVRDLNDISSLAGENGLSLVKTVPMPANNLSVILRKS